jgi:hypothetical protein
VTDLATAWGERGLGDECVRVWAEAVRQWHLTWPTGADVLEIGCQDADWLTWAQQADPTIQAVGVDWKGCKPGPGLRLKGNILTMAFPEASFDAIVLISTLEHIGLGHYDHDPLDAEGDTHTLQRCAGWLKPGGFVYADVPWDHNGYHLQGTKCRIYDDAAVQARLSVPGLALEHQALARLNGQLSTRDDVTGIVKAGGRPYAYTALLWRK